MKRSALKRKTPLRRTGRLAPVSRKRRGEINAYTFARKRFLALHRHCQAGVCASTGCSGRSSEIHHRAGRRGRTLLDFSRCLAVSRECHEWIEANGKAARELGLILPEK